MGNDDGDNRLESSSEESASEAECLKLLLGFDIEDVPDDAWENDAQADESTTTDGIKFGRNGGDTNCKIGTTEQASETSESKIKAVSYSELPVDATRKVFNLAYHSSSNGKPTSPPVKVVDMKDKGNGMIALRSIRRGEILFTERAAVAVQLQNDGCIDNDEHDCSDGGKIWPGYVRACQHCFRSLEPASSCGSSLPLSQLWPVQEYDENWTSVSDSMEGRYSKDSCGRESCTICHSFFCSECCRNRMLAETGSCCITMQALKAIGPRRICESDSSSALSPTMTSQLTQDNPPTAILMATRMFCIVVAHFRNTGSVSFGMFEGMCGLPPDVDKLELGVLQSAETNTHTNQPRHQQRLGNVYISVCDALSLTLCERESMSLELFCHLAAIAALNGFEITTQSPFTTYYTSLIRAAGGRGSERHQLYMKEVARTLGSEDGSLRRGMDESVENKVAVRLATIFPLTARINHSCEPCAEVRSQIFVDAHIDVVATRDIEKGEEITISYINIGRTEGRKDRHRRMKELRARYLFDCNCSRCTISSG